MAIEHAIWQITKTPARLSECSLNSELELEDLICADPTILSANWMLIGRQVATAFNKYVDLLAIDQTGSLIIIELKKNKTPRDVVAQALDYASWAKKLDSAEIAEIYSRFAQKHLKSDESLDQAFYNHFKSRIEEDGLNSSHQMVIVATEMDSSTERIVTYVNEYNIPLNVMFFRVFKDGNNRYLSRAWFIDPAETLEHATKTKETEPWNGEFYISFGHSEERNWDEALKHGFICAGGGRWYTRTLNQLHPGDRVWVNVPKIGYVGVGEVVEPAVKIDDFMVEVDGKEMSILDAPRDANYHDEYANDDDMAEYFVRVKWVKTVPVNAAKSEVGFFGNQNTVAKPTAPKWVHTVERLKVLFGV